MKRFFPECWDYGDEKLKKIKKKNFEDEHKPGKFVLLNKNVENDNLVIPAKKKKDKKQKTNNEFDKNHSGKLISVECKLSPNKIEDSANESSAISKKKNRSSKFESTTNNLNPSKNDPPAATTSMKNIVKDSLLRTKKNLKKKNKKRKETADFIQNKTNHLVNVEIEPQTSTASSALANKLRESLKGSRFRFINEQLYTTDGKDAIKIFKNDPDAFQAYHEGYRHQVEQWPKNPLDRIIKAIRRMSKHFIVGDFGCGEARLSRSVSQKVYSIDLVSSSKDVIASDMANTPLESEHLDVAVYCLSLMGVNLKDFLLEANRVLKMGGLVKIAEIASRIEKLNEFIHNVEKCGFKLLKKDSLQDLFCFLDFQKVRNVGKSDSTLRQFSLKPCLYKKR